MRTANASSRPGHWTDSSVALVTRTSTLGTVPITSFQTVWHRRLVSWGRGRTTPVSSPIPGRAARVEHHGVARLRAPIRPAILYWDMDPGGPLDTSAANPQASHMISGRRRRR